MSEQGVSGPLASETLGRYSYSLLAGSFGGSSAAMNDARMKLTGYTEASF